MDPYSLLPFSAESSSFRLFNLLRLKPLGMSVTLMVLGLEKVPCEAISPGRTMVLEEA